MFGIVRSVGLSLWGEGGNEIGWEEGRDEERREEAHVMNE
jgi:hypothetical protein